MNFGFTINQPRSINLDRNDLSISRKLLEELPELETCIACGNCTATCTAGNLTSFNLRKVQTLVRLLFNIIIAFRSHIYFLLLSFN